MGKPTNLFKTTIIIWSEYDASFVDLADLGRDATSGESYCSKQESVLVPDPYSDPDFPDTEFFGVEEEDEDD